MPCMDADTFVNGVSAWLKYQPPLLPVLGAMLHIHRNVVLQNHTVSRHDHTAT